MSNVIRLQAFLTTRPRNTPSMSNVDLMAELANLRHAAALLEIDLAQVKQRLLEELPEHNENGQAV
jgi:hypothetical protein